MPIHLPRRLQSAGAALLTALLCTGCVTTNADTGEPVPRGNQKYPYDVVTKKAEQLKLGMKKLDVLLLLGSPAEKDEADNLWIYLPERYAILIPATALRLEFDDLTLVDYGYRPIVLGARL